MKHFKSDNPKAKSLRASGPGEISSVHLFRTYLTRFLIQVVEASKNYSQVLTFPQWLKQFDCPIWNTPREIEFKLADDGRMKKFDTVYRALTSTTRESIPKSLKVLVDILKGWKLTRIKIEKSIFHTNQIHKKEKFYVKYCESKLL